MNFELETMLYIGFLILISLFVLFVAIKAIAWFFKNFVINENQYNDRSH